MACAIVCLPNMVPKVWMVSKDCEMDRVSYTKYFILLAEAL
jgi:hypothetical protein